MRGNAHNSSVICGLTAALFGCILEKKLLSRQAGRLTGRSSNAEGAVLLVPRVATDYPLS